MYLRYGDLSWDTLDADAPAQPSLARAGTTSPVRGRGRANGRANGRLPVVRLKGVELHAITEEGCIHRILEALDQGYGGVVVTPNLDHIRRCLNDMSFGALVAEADLVVADGMPLVWASRLQGTPLPERVAGSDLVSSLSAAAYERGRSLFLLGGAPGTADGAAKVLRERHPGIRIVGTHCPAYGFEKDEFAIRKMEEILISAKPDIIYVALGSPKQELLIHRLRPHLPEAWWLGVGNSFSFLSGEVRRAPVWMQRWGLEWIHRLLQEPKRLFRRYVIIGIPFATSLLGRSMIKGLAARVGRTGSSKLGLEPLSAGSNGQAHGNGRVADKHAGGTGALGVLSSSPALTAAETRHGTAHPPSAEGVRADIASPGRLARVRALVLLGGSVRPTALHSAIGRSLLDLPLNDDGSILNHWLSHAAEFGRVAGIEHLPVRVMVDWSSPEPVSVSSRHLPMLRVERDRTEYRGTGGVLRDLAGDYGDDDFILVANAAQVLLQPLGTLAAALDRVRGDVSIISHQDGTPSGLMLLRVGSLGLIPATGFVDMKEQVLPAIASRFNVKVLSRARPTGWPVRSLGEYISALRYYHRLRIGTPGPLDPLSEDWRPAFGIVEAGAEVDPLARVHDSVVLRGGRVEAGAVLVRSIVCPDGMVRRDRTAVDELVTAPEESKKSR